LYERKRVDNPKRKWTGEYVTFTGGGKVEGQERRAELQWVNLGKEKGIYGRRKRGMDFTRNETGGGAKGWGQNKFCLSEGKEEKGAGRFTHCLLAKGQGGIRLIGKGKAQRTAHTTYEGEDLQKSESQFTGGGKTPSVLW